MSFDTKTSTPYLKNNDMKKEEYTPFHQLCQGFSKLNRKTRLDRLSQYAMLNEKERDWLENSVCADALALSDQLVENVIGCLPLPLGIATNFVIDGTPRLIPMAVEETSIIAAASKTAGWIREKGTLTTTITGSHKLGQVHIPSLSPQEAHALVQILTQKKEQWAADINQHILPGLHRRGGGVTDIRLRIIPPGPNSKKNHDMGSVDIDINTCDAMGANAITQACEYLKSLLKKYCPALQVGMAIVSNLPDQQLTQARVTLPNPCPQEAQAIVDAAEFAYRDPYRAATHNKGILNGIDGLLIATGNDWRAVESGMHAYASKEGQYRSLTRWTYENNTLIGTLTAPIAVGIVGGVTQLHPTVKYCIQLMGIQHASCLSRISAAVGLVQNLGALRALTGEGVMQGHMRLHISNLLLAAGAKVEEASALHQTLMIYLKKNKKISLSDVIHCLSALRKNQLPPLEASH